MGQSLSKIYLHIIFHVKSSGVKILMETRDNLYAYINGIVKQNNVHCIQVGGTTDHVHLLCTLPRTITVAHIVEEIKRNSSKWLKEQNVHYAKFEWQTGYGVFSVSQSQVNTVTTYIQNQIEHHKHKSPFEEYEEWLRAYETEYDPRYFMKD